MSGTNQFQPFAIGSGANALTPAAYAALSTLISQGFQSGIANSAQVNTVLRQASFMAAALGQVIANAGLNANDDGTGGGRLPVRYAAYQYVAEGC